MSATRVSGNLLFWYGTAAALTRIISHRPNQTVVDFLEMYNPIVITSLFAPSIKITVLLKCRMRIVIILYKLFSGILHPVRYHIDSCIALNR